MREQIVSSKNRYHISNQFVSNYAKADCSIWARAAFAMNEQCVNDFGKVDTFVSTYERMKVMVVPLASIDSLVVLTTLPSVSVEYIIRKLSAFLDLCIHEKHSDKEYDIASGRQLIRK